MLYTRSGVQIPYMPILNMVPEGSDEVLRKEGQEQEPAARVVQRGSDLVGRLEVSSSLAGRGWSMESRGNGRGPKKRAHGLSGGFNWPVGDRKDQCPQILAWS